MRLRQIILSWADVDQLIDRLVPQFNTEFQSMVVITRGGIIPGGLLAEALDISTILTASVDFPAQLAMEERHKDDRLIHWPKFLQFPENELLKDKKVLIVDDVWGSGRTISSVRYRVQSAGGEPFTCVLHFNPYRNIIKNEKPDHYADVTDAHVIYPWEIHRGIDRVLFNKPEPES